MMITRNKVFAFLVSATLLGATVAHAVDGPDGPTDIGIETNTGKVLMPSSNMGSVALTCDTCASRSYQLTSSTLYKIGNSTVSFNEFAANVRRVPVRSMMVFVKTDRTVTRITVSAAVGK